MAATVGVESFPAPDEVVGYWAFDKMHAPRPITPLSGDTIIPTMSEGFTQAQAEYDTPIVVDCMIVNYYLFGSFHPHDDADVVADRLTRYRDTLAEKVPGVGARWQFEWMPEVVEIAERNKRADWTALSDDELEEQLQWFIDHMRYQWYIHGHINFCLLSASAFCDFYEEVMAPTDPTESYQCLQGFPTRSVDASRGLWKLSRSVRARPAVRDLFGTMPPDRLVAAAGEVDGGADFLSELDEFLWEFGWRSDAVYDMANVTWREDPSIAVQTLAGYVQMDDSQDPDQHFERAVARREELMAACRERLAGDPERLARFQELYEAAQYNLPVTEDHAFWIDQTGVACFRRFVGEIGRRLEERGIIAGDQDVHYLHLDELRDAMANGTVYAEAASARRAEMAAWADVTPPDTLGHAPEPESDPFMDALVVRLLGWVPPEENPDPNVLRGVAGSGGVVTGVARVVSSLEAAASLEDGEVMVCPMTLPPWVPMFSIASAIVTDTGGVLSHCAIVARELGIPAVVGTQVGTSVIATGQTITVDGDTGTVVLNP